MSEPDQCIICLDTLPKLLPFAAAAGGADTVTVTDQVPPATAAAPGDAQNTTTTSSTGNDESNHLNLIAALDGCDHIIHDACIRSWAQKTNTCPICRNEFHQVRVYNGLNGVAISTYDVEDKKQVAEFDVQQWLGENMQDDEDDSNYACPICDSSDHEDTLLLCDGCNAAYHTDCIGLASVPEGDWFCMECAHLCDIAPDPRALAVNLRETNPQRANRANGNRHHVRGQHVRTRGQQRRARRQARDDDWQGPWGQFTHRLFDLSDLDLDNVDDEDEGLVQFRRYQQLDRRELDRWRQRYDIARRLGARREFEQQLPPQISEHLQSDPEPQQPPAESQDERRAWGAFERARDAEVGSSNTNSRKRKARSETASPREPIPEPERKLKRPRTRRLPTQIEASSSPFTAGPSSSRAPNGTIRGPGQALEVTGGPLVSALLKELEPHTPTDDENPLTIFGWRATEASSPARSPAGSPAMSPTSSVFGSPRALSLTPPPLPSFGGRPGSPTLSLSTHIEPRYPPANYSPTRNRGSHSDTESSARRPQRKKEPKTEARAEPEPESKDKFPESRPLELRQPRPRRPSEVAAQAEEKMSLRLTMTPEEKKSINDIVKTALKPHWRAQKLTTEQYSIINRDISRKLYDEVQNAVSLDDESRRKWETRASQEVAQAVAGLQA